MKSIIIGIARTGSPNNFVLNPDTKYISMCGSKPEVSFSIDCGQYDFNRMINGLRYYDADPDASSEAITYFTNLTSKLFADLKYLTIGESDFGPLHVRLVITPFELAQIPFEFIISPDQNAEGQKIPLLAHPKTKIMLTREVRQESEDRYVWPHRVRILFVWAEPEAQLTVPHNEHLSALKEIIVPFAKPKSEVPLAEPDIGEFLTELPNASVESIKKALEHGISEKAPYTHIHILAHGGQTLVYGVTEFRLLLCSEGPEQIAHKIDGKSLAAALVKNDRNFAPAIVTLAVCDSAHAGNTILPTGSLAHQLHTNGIPCVFASQFPLTQNGSVLLVKTLYSRFFNGGDPRMALYDARMDLIKEQNHDWASLVAYARFPEDINEQLVSANLKLLFESMKVTNKWVDHVYKFWDKMEAGQKTESLQKLEIRLDTSIKELSKYLEEGAKKQSILPTASLQAEHLGLLGSGYKRKAEYFYRLIEFQPERKKDLLEQSRKSLENARDYYHSGFQLNPASHWTSMQYLSLKGILEGSLEEENDLWYVTKYMAQRDMENAQKLEDSIWAFGTLAELYLLKPMLCSATTIDDEIKSSKGIAFDYLKRMSGAEEQYNQVKESTARQFDRYINWWPDMFAPTYPPWLKDNAIAIRKGLHYLGTK